MMVAVLVLTPLSLLIARFIAKRSYTLFQKQTKARGLQTQLIEESLTQESLIQSFNAQDQFRKAFKGTNEAMPTIPNPLSFILQLSTLPLAL